MLVSIFKEGAGRNDAQNLHFETAPVEGDLVELDGKLLAVSQAWHKPDESCVGSKFAVLLTERAQAKAA